MISLIGSLPQRMLVFVLLSVALISSCKPKNEALMAEHTNHLIHEVSPYLLQHAHNPVNWYPWGKEAFALAREEDKPIFLSIGYSSCHWCHVMEQESFENEEIAALMNRLFVNIKVDREERPDIDQKYMQFVQMTTGSGGWPLTVFLTPEAEPFYGGTYFPPEERYGRPGLKKLLPLIAQYYHNDRAQLQNELQKIRTVMNNARHETQGDAIPDTQNWQEAVKKLSRYYDPLNGGLGSAPKFPSVPVFDLFLRHWFHTQDNHFLEMTEHTLQQMAAGGIYDQLAGGFARYSVDARWRVPHFEKMLYDNAQLSVLFLQTYQATQNRFYLQIARETLDFVAAELTDPEGGFYSSLDADSDGKEGAFYLWTKDQIDRALDEESSNIVCARFGVTERGNFEGRNILFVQQSEEELARKFHKTPQAITQILEKARVRLLAIRNKRVRPNLDYKVLTSWNGLMLSAFALGYLVTDDRRYEQRVQNNIRFVEQHLYNNGRLLHVFSKGVSKIPAFIDDYAYYIQGLIDSYEALFDEGYLKLALALNKEVHQMFYDKKFGGYYYAVSDEEALLKGQPMKSEKDGSLPSASAVMIRNLLRLFAFTGDKALLEKAEILLRKYGKQALEDPFAYATYLKALDFYLNKPVEIVLFPEDDEAFAAMRRVVFETYLPNRVVFVRFPEHEQGEIGLPLVQGRKALDAKTTAYVCVGQTCSLPLVEAESLKALLTRHTRVSR